MTRLVSLQGVVNHGETLKLLAKTTSQVAARLPRVRIVSQLYPTGPMRRAVENLYSEILRFLLMAHQWCNESKLRHIYRSFTRPHELRYSELLTKITDCSKDIIELAATGSQAEIRVMRMSHDRKLEDIVSALEASDRERKGQVDALAHLVARLASSEREQEKKLDLVIALLRATGLTVQDLLSRTESEGSRLYLFSPL